MQKALNTKPAETTIIHLDWADLAHRKDISTIADDIAGIYIWGFYKPPDFLPYYVGKATGNGTYSDIKHRLWTHVCRLMGGEYCILKKDNLRDFYKYKGKEWEQLAYVPGKHDIEDFINQRYDKLKDHIDEMVNNFFFTYAKADKDQVSDLEKSIIGIIGLKNLWNLRGGEPVKFKGIPDDLKKVIQSIE